MRFPGTKNACFVVVVSTLCVHAALANDTQVLVDVSKVTGKINRSLLFVDLHAKEIP